MSDRGYLDDVPLKLNKKFTPIPRPIFKEIDIHIPIDALEEDVSQLIMKYDFTHERKVLEDFKKWEISQKEEAEKSAVRKQKELEKKVAEEQRLKELAEAQSEVEKVEAAELERRRLEMERVLLEEKEAEEVRYQQSIESQAENNDKIMYQQRCSPAGSSSLPSHHSPAQSLHRSPNHFGHNILGPSHGHGKFDYSDFEPDTANPFDNAEINSINEMAVLASVLDHSTSRTGVSSSTKLNNVNYKDGSGMSSSCPTTSGNPPHPPGNLYYPQQTPNHQNPYAPPVLGSGLDWRPEGNYYGHPVDNDLRVTNSTSFKKLYFPLLSSMASRERERNAIKALGPLPHSQPQPTTLPVQSMSSPLLAQPPASHAMPTSVPHSHSYIHYKPYNEEP